MSKTADNNETNSTELYVYGEEGGRDTGPRYSSDVGDKSKPTIYTLQYLLVPPDGLEISTALRFIVLQKEPLTNKETERLRLIQKVNARLCIINAFWPLISKANIKYVRRFSWKNLSDKCNDIFGFHRLYSPYCFRCLRVLHVQGPCYRRHLSRALLCHDLSNVILGKKSTISFF